MEAALMLAESLSIVIPSCKEEIVTVNSLKSCPVPYQLITTNVRGVGKARYVGALKAKHRLLVMFDDDLVISPVVWQQVLALKPGEFMLTRWGTHLSSRIFACYQTDYFRVGGFNPYIQFTFEDGDFAARAQQIGLKLKVLSPSLLIHCSHKHRGVAGPFGMNLGFWREYAYFYVKYGRVFERNLFAPFINLPHDYKVVFQNLVIRCFLIFKACAERLLTVDDGDFVSGNFAEFLRCVDAGVSFPSHNPVGFQTLAAKAIMESTKNE
jgi:hypothetical protein